MEQHAQQTSATTSQHAHQSTQQISATAELDLPQSGSEDDDEAWLTELIGSKTSSVISEAYHQWEQDWKRRKARPISLSPMTQSDAEPDLPRTQNASASSKVSDLPGPLSRDDDEDSSPRSKDLDLAEHTSCSTRDLTTLGQESTALTHSGFQVLTLVGKSQLTGSTESCQSPPKNAHLSHIITNIKLYL